MACAPDTPARWPVGRPAGRPTVAVACPPMEATVFVLGLVVALAAALRSTWSPCGQSMLSQITPVGEASRGHRYRTTAIWYIVGAVAGGATLGALLAGLAAAVSLVGATPATLLGIAALLAVVGAAVDSGVLGFMPPFFKRQVNEYWLTKYRAWVYGSGFGWQIGAGVTTYIMTAGVFVTIAYAALTAGPLAAFSIGVFFGFARGSTVLLTSRSHTTTELFALHRRFDALGEPVRRAVIVVQLVVAVVAAGAAWGLVAGLAAAGVLAVAVLATVGVRRRPAPVAADALS